MSQEGYCCGDFWKVLKNFNLEIQIELFIKLNFQMLSFTHG